MPAQSSVCGSVVVGGAEEHQLTVVAEEVTFASAKVIDWRKKHVFDGCVRSERASERAVG